MTEQSMTIEAEHLAALGCIFEAVHRATRESTLIVVEGRDMLIDGLGSDRTDLDAIFDLDAASRDRLADLGGWPAGLAAARSQLEARFEDLSSLSDDDQRTLPAMIPATFLAAAGLVGIQPDHDLQSRAREACRDLGHPVRLIGSALDPIEAARFLGRSVADPTGRLPSDADDPYPRTMSDQTGQPIADAIAVLFAAVHRATSEGTLLSDRVEGLGTGRDGLALIFDLDPGDRARLADLADSPDDLAEASLRLARWYPETIELADGDRRFLARAIVSTFMAAAGLAEHDPQPADLVRAGDLCAVIVPEVRLFGKPLDPLLAAYYLGRHASD